MSDSLLLFDAMSIAEQHVEPVKSLNQILTSVYKRIEEIEFISKNYQKCYEKIHLSVDDMKILLDELTNLSKDTERYRFLRIEDNWGEDTEYDGWGVLGELSHIEFDNLVDARMAAEKSKIQK